MPTAAARGASSEHPYALMLFASRGVMGSAKQLGRDASERLYNLTPIA